MLMRGDTQGAMAQINEVLAKDQHDRQALLLRARVRAQTGQSDDLLAAVEDLKEVLVQEPNSRPGLYFMAQANFNLGNMDQARGFAGDLERNYPDYLPAKLMQAQISLASGDSKSAQRLSSELIERLAQTAPDRQNSPQMLAEIRAKALLARGAAELDQRNTKAARQDFMMARDAAPGDTHPHISLAGVALAEGKGDEAAAFYENALAIDSTNFNALSGLIRLYARNNELGKAHARIDQALNTYPNNASLHYLKAQIYGFERNSGQAEVALRKTLELDPNYIAAYSALGALFINTNQQERAIAEYQKILERRPDNATAYTLIGMLDDSRQELRCGRRQLSKGTRQRSERSDCCKQSGLALRGQRQRQSRRSRAPGPGRGAKEPEHPRLCRYARLGLLQEGTLWRRCRATPKSGQALDERAAKNGNGAPAANYQYHLGMALKARGDKEAARRALEQAVRLSEKTPFAEAGEARNVLATL